jgi:hypothetical protein
MDILRNTLDRLTLGQPRDLVGLAVFPLLDETAAESPAYLTLAEALADGEAVVSEVSENGRVPELRFENRSDRRILLLDGEELVGAKQNRVLNLTILVGPRRIVTIPVSCVEQGRWRWKSRRFAAAERQLYAGLRAKKMAAVSRNLRQRGEAAADQVAVWEDIARMCRRHGAVSATGAVDALYEKLAARLDDVKRQAQAAAGQVGALFAAGGRILGMELFDHPDTFARCCTRLVESYALETLGGREDAEAPQLDAAAARTWLGRLARTPATRHPGIDLGEDLRLSSPEIEAAALVADERIVHLSAFAGAAAGGPAWAELGIY